MYKNLIRTITFVITLITTLAAGVMAQELPKLSPLTRIYLDKAKQYVGQDHVPGYVYKNRDGGKLYVSSLVKVRGNSADADIKALGALVGTKAGNIWTVQVPVDKVEPFTKLTGIEYIQLDEPVFAAMDSARKTTRVDSAQLYYNINMPYPYTGANVVMGIIDAGFDYGHPAFFDTSCSSYRVKKVWEQKSSGTPPSGYAYGNELTDSMAMLAKGTDNYETHGTHVAGIAAGSGYGSTNNRRFRGMAYRSDLVFVGITPDKSQWINTGATDMLDGINYIFQYGASVNKAAVANLSWGSPLGPRDGTSLFAQAVDNLTGAGKIFVCSAGNNGANPIHIGKKFTTTDTTLHTFLEISPSPTGKTTWVDAWGDAGKNFCVKITLYNGTLPRDSTAYICLDNNLHRTYLIGSNNDTCFIDITTSASEFNGKPRIFMSFDSRVPDYVLISMKGTDGTINMWNSYVYQTVGYYGSFQNKGMTWATAGNTDMTMSDLAVTKSAITVGAYTSKLRYNDMNGKLFTAAGTLGALTSFSSKGPSADGRTMPFIAGPGMLVASSVSSYEPDYSPTGGNSNQVVAGVTGPRTGRSYYYAVLQGTSMSSPATAGIIALMLEANRSLDPAGVKTILTQTAIKDNFTGALATPDNNWGCGKVNAYGSILRAFQTSSIYGLTHSTANCTLFPNPSKGQFIIDLTAASTQQATVNVYGVKGNIVATEQWQVQKGANAKSFDLSRLQPGNYFTKIVTKEGTATIKTIIQ